MSPRLEAAAGSIALCAVGLVMLRWTWLGWPDPVVDFGREAYVPWQLAEGRRLYADLAYFNGPLSPYWNALLFRIFGVGMSTLFAANAALLALLVAGLHTLLRSVAHSRVATLACGIFLLLFAFAQYVSIGNYNYMAPYSHELTHGLLLCVAALLCLQGYRRKSANGALWLTGVGLALGATFLTKPEIFLAGAAACGTGLVAGAIAGRGRPSPAEVSSLAVGLLAPPLLAAGALATTMPATSALSGVLGSWPALLGSDVAGLDFYRSGLGSDEPLANLGRMLGWAGLLGLALAPGILLAGFSGRPSRWRMPLALLLGLLLFGLWAGLSGLRPWIDGARALPLLIAALLAHAIYLALRDGNPERDRDPERDRHQERVHDPIARIVLLCFALVLLAKMLLHARLVQYGFVLAMPATLLLWVALFDWIPRELTRRGFFAPAFRAGAAALLVASLLAHLQIMERQVSRKRFEVGSGADRIRVDGVRGPVLARTLEVLEARLAGAGELVVLPEGILLNYWLRTANPTPYLNFMPPELAIFGEQRIRAALDAAAPSTLALVHKDTSEYGVRFFGRDYALSLAELVSEHYRPLQQIGDPPFAEEARFGITILGREQSD